MLYACLAVSYKKTGEYCNRVLNMSSLAPVPGFFSSYVCDESYVVYIQSGEWYVSLMHVK